MKLKIKKLLKINFKEVSITFFFLLIDIALVHYFVHEISAYIYILTFLGYALILAWGSAYICSNFYISATCKLEETENCISITFDDGPNPNSTPQILNVLEKHNVKATFFCIGMNAEKYPELVKKIIQKGHTIGNHTYTHSYFFDIYRTSKVYEEIIKTNTILEKISETKIKVFRPPFGVTNPNIARAVKRANLKVIGWNLRTLDAVKDKKTVEKRLQKIKNGDIVLFHDTKKDTIKILDDFLRLCNEKELKIIPLKI